MIWPGKVQHFVPFALSLLLLCSKGVVAQHVHDSHTGAPHNFHANCGGQFQRMSWMPGGGMSTPNVTLDSEDWEIVHEQTFTNLTCEEKQVSIANTSKRTHSVETSVGVAVAGSVQFAAGALFAKCKLTAGARVSGEKVWGETEEHSVTTTEESKLLPCQSLHYVLKDRKKTASGTITSWDCVTKCQCTRCSAFSTTYCNFTEVTGNATGWQQSLSEWGKLPKPADCEICQPTPPTPPVPPPDPVFNGIIFPILIPIPGLGQP